MMSLYSGTTCPFSHSCRIMLHEKGVEFQVVDIDLLDKAKDLSMVNPYGVVPVLIERDLILYEPSVINEYVDERVCHPPLIPLDPVTRARARQFLITLDHNVFKYVRELEQDISSADNARKSLTKTLTDMAPSFTSQKYILGDEFSVLDIALAPLLWRLSHYGIKLQPSAAALLKYAERIFSRQGFIDSLTPAEKGMRF